MTSTAERARDVAAEALLGSGPERSGGRRSLAPRQQRTRWPSTTCWRW